ncbi:ketopantoate reductase family protein [Streptomyces sp. NPDC096176]|uniref:ketopantoate reductase family protein n=1 Tax=Streptomyces sp. NPDC096176 TaxID=3366079 RepID=UPI00380105A9
MEHGRETGGDDPGLTPHGRTDADDRARISARSRAAAEGRAVLAAAGIDVVSAAEESDARSGRMELRLPGDGPRGGGSSLQNLTRGTGTIEADYLNGEVTLLGRLHGVPTPVVDVLLRTADAFARDRRRAGSMTLAELTALVDVEVKMAHSVGA